MDANAVRKAVYPIALTASLGIFLQIVTKAGSPSTLRNVPLRLSGQSLGHFRRSVSPSTWNLYVFGFSGPGSHVVRILCHVRPCREFIPAEDMASTRS